MPCWYMACPASWKIAKTAGLKKWRSNRVVMRTSSRLKLVAKGWGARSRRPRVRS